MENTDKQMRDDLRLAIMALCQPVLTIFQGLLIGYGVTSADNSTIVRAVLSALLVFTALPVILKSKPDLFFISYIIVGLLVFLEWLCFPVNRPLIISNSVRFIFPILIPSFLAIPCMKYPIEALNKGLLIISWLIIIETVFFVIIMLFPHSLEMEYDMGTGFSILVAAIYCITKQDFKYYLISFGLTIVILLFCSRSPILAIAIFAVYYFFIEKRKSKMAILLMPVLILIVVLIKPILLYTQSLGLDSRTISMFLEGDIESASGRDFIYPIVIKGLEDNPILGVGIYGDRLLYPSDNISTAYPHNLFLEILVQYGVFFGSIFIIVIFLPIFRIWRIKQDYRILFMVIAIGCLVPLIFSGSYLVSPLFATYMGFCYFINRNRKVLKVAKQKNLK